MKKTVLKSFPMTYYLSLFMLLTSVISCTHDTSDSSTSFTGTCSVTRDTLTLSGQLDSITNLMETKTGVYVLEQGDISMVSRAWLTEHAEKTIDIQYFIFSVDNVGLIASDFLIRAADRGIKIRILVDDITVEAKTEELLALDAHSNLSIKIYNPTANIGKNLPEKVYQLATNFVGVNQRMHNKTFIVDEQIVITGGRNIADEYFDYDHEYNFRDRDVLLLGKITGDVQRSFQSFWNSELSVPIASITDPTKFNIDTATVYNYLHQYACNPQNFWPQVRKKMQNLPQAFQSIQRSEELIWVDSIQYISDIPGKNDGTKGFKGGGVCTSSLIELIKDAKESVCIQSPYLVTTHVSQDLFRDAVARGVEVKISTNSLASTDNIEAFSGYQRDRELLLETGVRIFEFKPDAKVRFEIMTGALQKELSHTPIFGLHAKSMVVDKKIAVIGTFNLDPRSANLNTECITVIHSEKIARDLFSSISRDMSPENSWETTVNFNPDSVAGMWKQLKTKTRRMVPKSVL